MSRLPHWCRALLLIAAALIAYQNSFHGPFVFDDLPSIPANPSLHHWREVWSPPTKGETVTGRPILNASFAINYWIGRNEVVGYHIANLAIHICAGLLLFGIVRRTLRRVSPAAERWADGCALVAALIWIVHPLQTEAVTYIVQRAESLMGLFYFATIYAFLRAVASREADFHSGLEKHSSATAWFGLSVVACVLGMATKEVMVSAPVLVCLYDRTFVSGSWREAWLRRGWYYLGLAASWIVLFALVFSTGGDRGGSTGGLHAEHGWLSHGLTQFESTLTYLKLTFWPHPLVFEYDPVWRLDAADLLFPMVVVGALFVGTAWAVWERKPIGFAGGWFFAILAPTAAIPAQTQLVVEHRMYLALGAVVIVVVFTLGQLAGRRALILMLAAAVPLTALTIRRNHDYRSDIALWSDTVAKRPNNALAHFTLADALRQANRAPEAIAHYEQALRITPNYVELENNYGALLTTVGRAPEAVEHLEHAVQNRPNDAETHYNLGLALVASGRLNEAVREFNTSTRLKPDYVEAYNNLGGALLHLRRWPEAAQQYEQALRLAPKSADAHYNLGTVWWQLGRWTEAAAEFQRTIALTPNDPDAHAMLGAADERLAQFNEAMAEYESALRLNPQQRAAILGLQRLRGAGSR
jgi:protein O-mannosyl-transferase